MILVKRLLVGLLALIAVAAAGEAWGALRAWTADVTAAE